MRLRRAVAASSLPLLVVLALWAAPTPPAHAAHAAPDATVLAQRGFGNVHNSYAWGMAWFRGALYVGTGRYVACMEAATTDFYFPVAKTYRPYKMPSIHCPRNRWNMDLRAEIWRYTPSNKAWVRVYRSPTVANPRAPGKQIARDIAYRGMSVHKDPQGKEALFVSGVSPDEIVPELRHKASPRLLRTYDGVAYTNIGHSFIVDKTGSLKDQRVMGFRGITWWRGRMYALASTAYAGDGAVFRVLDPWGRGPSRFRQVSAPWMHVFEMEVFRNNLYIGSGSATKGYSVWKTRHTTKPFHFKPIVTDGAGRGPKMTGVIAMHVFKHHLYVSAVSWYATDDIPSTEMIRIARDDTWQVVVGRPRVGADHIYRYPISGLMDGFENIFMPHIWRIADQNGALYAGTLDWSYLLQDSKDWPPDDKPNNDQFSGLLSQVLAGELGFDIWTTCDGTDWFPTTRTAFNGDEYDFGVRTMQPAPDGKMYIGTADHGHGTRIFQTEANDCQAFPGTHGTPVKSGPTPQTPSAMAAAVAAARPQHLLTDVQRDGTVLSWEHGATPARYDVIRTAPTAMVLSFTAPLTNPDGFTYDGQLPQLVPAGTPNSTPLDVPLPGRSEVIGTTTGSFFVDRTAVPGARYTYSIVTEGPAGRRLASNFQAVPDPRPVPTFAQLEQALPTAQVASVRADVARWAGAHPADALARVKRLARTADSDTARDIARRLARRLEYADVAGGPVGGS